MFCFFIIFRHTNVFFTLKQFSKDWCRRLCDLKCILNDLCRLLTLLVLMDWTAKDWVVVQWSFTKTTAHHHYYPHTITIITKNTHVTTTTTILRYIHHYATLNHHFPTLQSLWFQLTTINISPYNHHYSTLQPPLYHTTTTIIPRYDHTYLTA